MNKILILLATVIFTACGQQAGQNNQTENASAHSHEAIKLQYTSYSKYYEVFAEADPFIIGQKAEILAHFTKLSNFKPLSNKTIIAMLQVNGEEWKHVKHQPSREGIYRFQLEPESAGNGKLIFVVKGELDAHQIIVNNVKVYTNTDDAHEIHHKEGPSLVNTIAFTKEQSWKVGFATDSVSIGDFGPIIKTTAIIQSAQGDEIVVSAKTNGIIQMNGENILVGKEVNKGQTLFNISGNQLASNNSHVRFIEAENNYKKAKAEYERHKKLAADKIVSEEDLQNFKNQYENASVIYKNLKKNFDKGGQQISSPIDGFVRQLIVSNGEYVEVGQAMLVVSQNKKLLLHAEIQQRYAYLLGKITDANIRTPHNNKTYTLHDLNGRIVSFGKSTSTDNFMIPITLEIENKGDFYGGTLVELYLKASYDKKVLCVPNSALIEEQGNFSVFVQANPELFEKREVKLGASDGKRTEIVNGIVAGERIVTKGAILVKLSQASAALDPHAGHVH